MNKIPIAIVEDHKMLSHAMESIINEHSDYQVIINDDDGESFLRILDKTSLLPEIVLMDINLHSINGIKLTQIITEKYQTIKVIALTLDDNEETVVQMFQAGAKGYLLKDMHPDVLFEAMRKVIKYGFFYSEMIYKKLHTFKNYEVENQQKKECLSEKEKELIQWMCSSLTYKEIAKKMFLTEELVHLYKESIYSKLEINSRTELLGFAMQNGWSSPKDQLNEA